MGKLCLLLKLLFCDLFDRIGPMANVEKKGYVDPGWPKHIPRTDGHVVTEITSTLAGASSPYGDDLVLPRPAEELGYVHPYTRFN